MIKYILEHAHHNENNLSAPSSGLKNDLVWKSKEVVEYDRHLEKASEYYSRIILTRETLIQID